MSYLLDTNIISETIKPIPNPNVLQWLDGIPSENLYISVLTIGEIKKGVELLENSNRKNILIKWLEHDLAKWFENNILEINLEVAERWGYLSAISKKTTHTIDTFIAATALTYNLKLVTRNEKDFEIFGLEIINPFK